MKHINHSKTFYLPGVFIPSLALLLCLLSAGIVQAAGLLTPKNSQYAALEIKQHDVNVIIEDGYAITKVDQIFHNPNAQDLEAIYSFPVPEKAAVAEFTVWIDGKPVTGEVLEKKQARQIYESEKAAGREAGLTEKDGYKTFDISVTAVRAEQDTRIRFVYLQPAHVDTGIGRYVYPLEEGGVDEKKLSFWTANEEVKEKFSFNLQLKSAYPVEAMRLPNQPQAMATQTSPGEWNVQLVNTANTISNATDMKGTATQPISNQPAFTLDQDLVVYWRHKAGLPGSVDMVTYKPEGSNKGTFMLTVTLGDDLKPVTEGSDWVFVLDISGSMQGKYTTLADGVLRALGKMRANDRFRILLFNSAVKELTHGYVNATPESVKHYSSALMNVQPSSGTNLYAGLRQALDSIDADRTSAIVLVTDGVANVGETKQKMFLKLLKKKDIRLFTFIMGNSANKPLLEAMTKASNGFALNISNSDDIVGKILEATSKVSHESLHGVKLSISGVRTSDLTPKTIGSLYRGQQLVMFGHYWGDGIADVRLTGKISGQQKEYRTQVEFPSTDTANPELERLWAFATIEGMMEDIHNFGEDADVQQAVTDLAIEHGLVTDYTSMLVVRDELFESFGIKRNNRDRLNVEHAAQQARVQQVPVSHRVDTNQPMFTENRPSFSGKSSGGGSIDPWMMLILLPVVYTAMQRRKTKRSNNIPMAF
ncbi:Inter-alpha-trypsin inhibitor heavy chain H3 precursor [hydrothermal vent metagenome]|uniref:Inter-alpha-trypsin inhibitor heavy chain H3 n=1 Tax=hydrothermal vent metagenome TaxID=652676 RepID=A0A3B0YXY6_9ZZZZ